MSTPPTPTQLEAAIASLKEDCEFLAYSPGVTSNILTVITALESAQAQLASGKTLEAADSARVNLKASNDVLEQVIKERDSLREQLADAKRDSDIVAWISEAPYARLAKIRRWMPLVSYIADGPFRAAALAAQKGSK